MVRRSCRWRRSFAITWPTPSSSAETAARPQCQMCRILLIASESSLGRAPDGLRLVGHASLVERGWARQGEVVHLAVGPSIGRERRRLGAAWRERRSHAVGRVVGQPEEEGTAPARAAVEKPSRLAGEHVRRVVTALVAVAHAAPFVADLIAVVARILDELKPAVESRGRAHPGHVVVPIQELAHEPGAVPRPVEPDRKRVSRIAQIRVSRVVGEHAVVVRILPGQDPGAGRAAQGWRRDPVREARPRTDDPAKRPRHVLALEGVLGLVVGQDDQEVGGSLSSGLRCRRSRGRDGARRKRAQRRHRGQDRRRGGRSA